MRVPNRQYKELHDLEAATSITAGKHLQDAIQNYLNDVAPVLRWKASKEGTEAAKAALHKK